VLVFADAIAGRRLAAPADGFSFYLPLHVIVGRMWRDGVLPVWDPWTFAGSPLLSLHQAGVLYPPNWLHVVLPPVTAENLVVASAFVVAAVGAWLLARRLTDDPVAATAAGLAFGLSGFLFAHVGHGSIIATAAWLPWGLWGLDLVIERLTPARLAAGAGAVALGVFAGHSQMWLFSVLVLGGWGFARTVADRRLRPVLLAAAVIAAGTALGAVQLLPVLATLGESDRQTLEFVEATAFSLDPKHAPVLVFPYVFGNNVGGFFGARATGGPFTIPYLAEGSFTEISAYVGAAAFVLAGAGLGAVRRDRRAGALVAVGVVVALVALGDSTPVADLVYALPVLGQLRSWGRYAVGLDLVVALLAAYGVAELRAVGEGAARRRRAAAIRAVVALGVLVVIAGIVRTLGDYDLIRVLRGDFVAAVGIPLAAAAVAALAAVASVRWRAAALVAVAVIGLDMVGAYGWWAEWRTISPTPAQARAAVEEGAAAPWGPVPDAGGGIERFAYASADPLAVMPWFPRLTAAAGLRSVNGYDPLAPEDFMAAAGGMDYRGAVLQPEAFWAPGSDLLDLLRVSLLLADPNSTPYFDEIDDVVGPSRPVPDSAVVAVPRTPALPEAWLVGEVREVGFDEAALAARGWTDLDPAATALVDGGCDACAEVRTPGPAGSVAPGRWGPSSVAVTVAAERPALLVVSQAWFPGWRAEVDGEAADVVRVDGVVQGVPVPAGDHEVVLRYRPPGLVPGALVTVAAAAALAGWAVLRRMSVARSRRGGDRPTGT
jgi:hypothetical protein